MRLSNRLESLLRFEHMLQKNERHNDDVPFVDEEKPSWITVSNVCLQILPRGESSLPVVSAASLALKEEICFAAVVSRRWQVESA